MFCCVCVFMRLCRHVCQLERLIQHADAVEEWPQSPGRRESLSSRPLRRDGRRQGGVCRTKKTEEQLERVAKKEIEEMKKTKGGPRRVLIKWREKGLKGCIKGRGN